MYRLICVFAPRIATLAGLLVVAGLVAAQLAGGAASVQADGFGWAGMGQ